MIGRGYSIEFHNISVAAVQDLLAIYCGASMGIALRGMVIGQVTGVTVQNLRISVKRLASTVTSGSGGSTVTPKKQLRGDTAATVTARANDTTQASSSGVDILHSDAFNTINGYQFFFPPNALPTVGLNEAAIFSLDEAPTSGLTMSATFYFAEVM